MISKLYNLRCRNGHRHYSPDPDKWVGRACLYPTEKNDTRVTKKCPEPLARMEVK